MENEPFEDAFPIENGDFPASYVSLPEGNMDIPAPNWWENSQVVLVRAWLDWTLEWPVHPGLFAVYRGWNITPPII